MASRSSKPHPADAAAQEIVDQAVRYDAALFLGTGRYATDSANTLEEAQVKAQALAALHPNGRKPLIYAVVTSGRSALVIPKQSLKEQAMKTYAKKFNAQRAAKKAGHDLANIEIVKANGGYSFRVKDQPAATKQSGAQRSSKKQSGGEANGRPLGKRAAIEAAARKGTLPAPPDFSAPTHVRFRSKLQAVIDLAKSGDLTNLRKFEVKPVSSSPKAIARYRDLCVLALEARAAE